jgi:hypothetical protein
MPRISCLRFLRCLKPGKSTIRLQLNRASLSCGFRGKAVRVPGRSRAAFRNEAGHDSGMNPVTDSDFKPVTFRRLSEP